ncbi:MAG: 30S ribosomal protein S21 [Candidatus Uhrbacteria bacterium]|nr:30S ribosomal protein S21 [Candidatus Uhrbacteria bacterium]
MSHIDTQRKKGESFEGAFRRFTLRFRLSGKRQEVMSGRYFSKKPSKNRTQESALRRLEMGAKRDHLIRTGKLKEEERGGRR